MSTPSSTELIPAATAAAPPPVDPPGVRSRSHGLFVRPNRGLFVCASLEPGGRLVLPSKTAPAARIRATTGASRSGMRSTKSGNPPVVRRPAVSSESLTVKGTPWRGPHTSPRAVRVEGDDGGEGGVVPRDLGEVRLQHLDRGHLPRADAPRQLRGGRED